MSKYINVYPNTIEIPFSYYGLWLGFAMDFSFVFVDILIQIIKKRIVRISQITNLITSYEFKE